MTDEQYIHRYRAMRLFCGLSCVVAALLLLLAAILEKSLGTDVMHMGSTFFLLSIGLFHVWPRKL